MKRKEISTAIGALTSLSSRPLPIKMAYAIAKNLSKAKAEWKIVQEGMVPKIEGLEDYEKERVSRLEAHSNKDESGNPKFSGGPDGLKSYDIDPEKLNELNESLEEDFAEVRQGIQDHNDKVREFLDEDAGIKWHGMSFEWFGEMSVPPRELEPLLEIFSDEP